VVLDEAYREFNTLEDPDATLDLLPRFPNLVLLRTFSKVYGLCGLRVGFALCGCDEFVRAVDQVRQPFFCNAAAQAAAIESLEHGDEVTRRVERAIAGRLQLEEGLRGLGLLVADSQANFVWTHLPEEAEETLSRTEANLTHHLIAAAAAAHRETLVAVDRLGERRLVILAGLRAAGLPAPPRHPR